MVVCLFFFFLICFVVCVLSCVCLCDGLWWPCLGPIYDVYIICGFGFGLVGWPSLAVCVPLI